MRCPGRAVKRFALAALVVALAGEAACAECHPVPPPVRDLALERFYEDSAGSIVEPTRLEAHKAETAPLVEFVGTIAKLADEANRKPAAGNEPASCALGWLKSWADGGAYLGRFATKQAEAQRNWDLAGLALAYIKLKPWATDADRAAIEPWLATVADKARAVFDDSGVKRNNHWYWLGLAEGAVAVVTGNEERWNTARSIMEDAARDIAADGTLPLELAREGRALHYHAFAAMPLVALAELAAARGDDFYALGDGALHRLVARTIAGLNDPTQFDKLAGVVQQRPVHSGAGWIALYGARFPEKLASAPEQPPRHRWLGGDVGVLSQVLARKR